MAVEIFTREQFEAALPRHKTTGQPLCDYLGFVDGEFTYALKVNDQVAICIRSSVDRSGSSAGTGEDSIRTYLVGKDGKGLGKGAARWIARTGKWRDRLKDQLRTLYQLGLRLPCKCGKVASVRKVKKEGANRGRLFIGCDCGRFEWEQEQKAA